MKKEEVQQLSLVELQQRLKQQKLWIGLLAGLGIILMAFGLYDYFRGLTDRNFWSSNIIGLCTLAMIPYVYADVKLLNEEIAERKRS